MNRLLCLFALFLLTCGIVPLGRAQQVPDFNMQQTWQAALQVAGEPLVLPAAQRGIQFCQTYAFYHGRQYLFQRLHYDPQGRLDTLSQYYLVQGEGQLHSALFLQVLYHLRIKGASLVGQQEMVIPTTNGLLRQTPCLLRGNIPPVEPLLGTGAAAHRARLPRRGQLRNQDQRPQFDAATHYTLRQWGKDKGARVALRFTSYTGTFDYSQEATLDRRARTLSVERRTSRGGIARFTRSYLDRGQDYVERCRASWLGPGVGGGSSVEGDLYTRTVHYAQGLCRTEHFTVLDQHPVAGAYPEFEVRHQYTFYSAKRARHFHP